MICQACHRLGGGGGILCADCMRRMRPAADRLLPGGLRLIAAFEHVGPARALVHHLKYRGLVQYGDLVASVLVPRLPRVPLVPVPRALTRRIRYGVDPARILADRLAAEMGVPVLPLLETPIHSRRRAGRDHRRPVATFRLRRLPAVPVAIVDDVVTTGATMLGACRSIGASRVHAAVAANAVSAISQATRFGFDL